MSEPALPSSGVSEFPKLESKPQLGHFSDDELQAELVKRGFSVLGPSSDTSTTVDVPSNIINLDDVRAQKTQDQPIPENINTIVGRENFQRQVQQGMENAFPPVATEISDTLSSPLQLDRMTPSVPPPSGLSEQLHQDSNQSEEVATSTPSTAIETPKPTEEEYTQKLADATANMSTVRNTESATDAIINSTAPSKPSESDYTETLKTAADAAEQFRNSLGQNNVSPNPTPPANYSDTLAAASADLSSFREGLGQNNALNETSHVTPSVEQTVPTPAITPEPTYAGKLAAAANDITQFRSGLGQNNVLNETSVTQNEVSGSPAQEKAVTDEQVQRILDKSREKAKERVGGMKTRVGLAIGAAIFGALLLKEGVKAPEAEATTAPLSPQGVESPALQTSDAETPYVLPENNPVSTGPSGGSLSEAKPVAPSEPVISSGLPQSETSPLAQPEDTTDAVVPGNGEEESELPDANMVEVTIDEGGSISEDLIEEHPEVVANATEFNEKYYKDPQIMTGIVLYNWEEFQQAWKGKEGFPASLDEYMQLVVKADGGDTVAQAKLLEITQHGADMVEQGQEYYVPATPQDGKDVYHDLVDSYKEDPVSFPNLLHEIEETKKDMEEHENESTAPVENTMTETTTAPVSSISNTVPLSSPAVASPLGALASAAGGAGDGVSHEPVSPLPSASTQESSVNPVATNTMASNISTAGIPAQPPIEQQVQTPVQKKKKFLGIF